MWPLLENIFEYISFKHTWEDGTHRTEFKCENCYKIVDIGQNNEISYESETYTTGCFTCDRCRKMLKQAGADITGQLQVRPILYTLVCGMWYVVCGMWYLVCGM